MRGNLDIIRATYEGSSADNGERLRQALAPDCVWTEAAGFPYAGTYVGPDEVFTGVFQRLATEWIDYRAAVDSFVTEADHVVAFGHYTGTYKATGRSMRAAFAHHWTLRDGKIVRMVQYVDSYLVQQAIHGG
jgi:hypothetical protein